MKIENFFKKMLCVFLSLMIIIPASLSNYFASETINKNWCPPIPLDDSDSDSNSDTETVVPEGPSVDFGASIEKAETDSVTISAVGIKSSAIMESDSEPDSFDFEKFKELCDNVAGICEREPSIVYIKGPAIIIGDLHGSLHDVQYYINYCIQMLQEGKINSVVFLGDYGDRGEDSVGVLNVVMEFKTSFPGKVFLLRGNHEFRNMYAPEKDLGYKTLRDEVMEKCQDLLISQEILFKIDCIFNQLPYVAIIDEKVFFMHGGIPHVSFWENLQYYMHSQTKFNMNSIEICKLVFQLTWNDPAPGDYSGPVTLGFAENTARGPDAWFFTKTALEHFHRVFPKITAVVRGHQFIFDGFEESLDGKVPCYTVFSASDYGGCGNRGAIAFCDKDGKISKAV